MAREWTAEQRLAIDTRDKSLLVSAAAGSGKTATLTQRIIESILDGENPTDISKMLIVTFTRAAVGELRERIGGAIKEGLEKDPTNTHLERQLMLLPSAKILTIDAFCNDCLKAFPEAVGIAPGYRIADEAEILLMSRDVFDGITEAILRDELSDKISAEDFERLSDCLADSRQMADAFDIFRSVHQKLRNTAMGVQTLEAMVEEYNPEKFTSADNTVFGKYILKYERDEFLLRAKLFSDIAERLEENPENIGNYAELARADAEAYTRVANSTSFSELKTAVEGLSFGTRKSPRGVKKTPLMELFAKTRDKEKKSISNHREKLLFFEEDDWRASFSALYPLMKTFYNTLLLFDAALLDRKKKLFTFDYTDIERLTLSALIKDGEPTEAAKSIREQYDYVYIDEYQDVNDLQDLIFRSVSKESNRFTVGDIKQSIYGFRFANPKIFAEAKRSYPNIENAEGYSAASLFMSKNFRSSRGIIDFVNAVFDTLFEIFKDGIDYSKRDRLEAGRPPLGESYFAAPEICIHTAAAKKNGDGDITDTEERTNFNPYEEDFSEISDDTEEEEDPLPPITVATKIKNILKYGKREDGSPVKPSDIAIILRAMKNKSDSYLEALKAEGIPVKTSGKKNIFLNPDVLLALCLLNSINNPLRDVYLTGLLRSPLFGFSADELVMIRGKEKYKPFYQSLVEYTERHGEFTKGRNFISTLEAWREIAEGIRTDRLIARLFRETGLLALAAEHGEKENLIRLYEYARSFEGSSFGGVGSFITYINNVIAENGKFDCNISASEDDAVTITSSHSSKGLEYPIVFYVDTGKSINYLDAYGKFLFLQDFGLAARHRTPRGLAVVNNPMINALSEKIKEETFEEELRMLYVALTRARERLYIIGSVREKSLGDYKQRISSLSAFLSDRAAARRLSSHLDMIVAASGYEPISPEEFLARESEELCAPLGEARTPCKSLPTEDEVCTVSSGESTQNLDTGTDISSKITKADEECDDTLSALYRERFSYKYHSPLLAVLPEKMSVSALYPTVLDGNESEIEDILSRATDKGGSEARTVPEFVAPSKREESKRRGIATHLFLQFCDLLSLEKNGAEKELARLEKCGFISADDAPRVRISEVSAFLNSELFGRMRGAKSIWREFRFNTALPAELFTENEDKANVYRGKSILIQGVIDCIIESADGAISIIDYKTDRLTDEELASPELAEMRLRASHEDQLYYYCLAAERIFGKKPISAEVFSLHLGRCVDVMKKRK